MKPTTYVQFSTVNLNVVITTTKEHAAKIAAYILNQAAAAKKERDKINKQQGDQ